MCAYAVGPQTSTKMYQTNIFRTFEKPLGSKKLQNTFSSELLLQDSYNWMWKSYLSFVYGHSLKVNLLIIRIKQSISCSHIYWKQAHFTNTSNILWLSHWSKGSDWRNQNQRRGVQWRWALPREVKVAAEVGRATQWAFALEGHWGVWVCVAEATSLRRLGSWYEKENYSLKHFLFNLIILLAMDKLQLLYIYMWWANESQYYVFIDFF